MSSHDKAVPLGQPPLRQWELDSSSTRYEKLVAAPSDHDLRLIWSMWVGIQGVLSIFVAIVFVSILRSKPARRNPFNVYLVYLMVPDLVFGVFCTITCLMNAIVGHYYSPGMCLFQSFYLMWGVTGNAWLNAVISWQLHSLLTSSLVRRKYKVPTRKQVSVHAAMVYVYAAFVASMGLWSRPLDPDGDADDEEYTASWFPHRTAAMSGEGCAPLEFNRASSYFFFLVFVPMAALVPLLYVMYVCYDIWHRNLMPPTGRRRLLSIYFTRIVAAFVIMWVPYLILSFVAGGWPWALFVGGTWGHLQGAVSAAMSLFKPDISKAVKDTIQACRSRPFCCVFDCCLGSNSQPGQEQPPSSRLFWTLAGWRSSNKQSSYNVQLSSRFVSADENRKDSSCIGNRHDSSHSGEKVSPCTPNSTFQSGEQQQQQQQQEEESVDGYLPRQREDYTFEGEVDVEDTEDTGSDIQRAANGSPV